MFATILAVVYAAIALWVFWWLAPRSKRLRMDHLTSAALAVVWPLVLLWLIVICTCEMIRPDYNED